MTEKAARRAWMVLPVIAAALVSSACTSSSDDSLAPTAVAVKRYAANGALDTAGFGGGSGVVATKIDPAEFEYALAAVLQADGKIVAVGHSVLNARGAIAVVRYNTNGSLDATFGGSGIVRTPVASVDAVGTAVVQQPGDGKILVAGATFDAFTGDTGIALVRYNPDGSLDTAGFGSTGIVSAAIGPGTGADTVSLALQGTNIVVAGATTDGNFVLRRYDSAGTLDTASFGTSGIVTTDVNAATSPAIALRADGGILAAGGTRSSANALVNAVLVRYSADGVLDTTFGGATGGIVLTDVGSSNNFSNAIVVQPDDKAVAVGHAHVDFNADTSDIALIRYNADGTLDSTFGTANSGAVVTDLGAFDNAFSAALQPTGEILVSGNTSSGGIPSVALLRYTAAGVLDATFGAGGIVTTAATGPSSIASGNAVQVQSDGGIVVAGFD